uniref:2-hydroxyflavanone C-glycosyltransferase n=1 Tax=Pistia stratiotes TaxID=4477 RepID=A0A859N6X8_PISST|nr:2-hydroxyflavanone C-glycosyltransferase [Pistia stratiotes]
MVQETSPPVCNFRDTVSTTSPAPHIAILSSAGFGHLIVSVRLAVALASHGCLITLVTPLPTVSEAESRYISDFHSCFPHIRLLEFHLLPLDAQADTDPFFSQFETIRRSAALLGPLLASATPPLSALLADISVLSSYIPVTKALGIPTYVTFTSCAAMLALSCVFPRVRKEVGDGPVVSIDIPGLGTVPGSWIPPPLHNPNHIFARHFSENGAAVLQADGVLVNTFEALEGDILSALNAGTVLPGLPPVIAIGPQEPLKLGASARPAGEPDGWATWLDAQPPKSVLYVAFGNRTALSTVQIRELGKGLEKSGCRFLWVVKSKIVDKDESVELDELLGEGYLERVGDRGMVAKSWVDQEEVLAHPSVGGFLSHGGCSSSQEAILHGVRSLNWPGMGDQRMVAAQAEKRGAGVWVKEWGWSSRVHREEPEPVSSEEIAKRVKELMEDDAVGEAMRRIHEEAVMGLRPGGSSYEGLRKFVALVEAKRRSSPPQVSET